jgi:uncharacterized membrane protein
MIDVRGTAPVSRDAVWAVLSDLEAWPAWLPTVASVVAEAPEQPVGVGASYRVRQPKLPAATWTVTRWEPGVGFEWESTAPGVTTVGGHWLEPDDRGTGIVLTIAWRGPMAWLARLVYGRLTRRYVEQELAALTRRAASGSGG